MTDEQLDRKLRAADPFRPEITARLQGAEQHLLEEIMSVPALTVVKTSPTRKRLLAAAAFLGVLALLIPFRPQPGPPQAPPERTPVAWQKFAEESPRLLIAQDGWKVVTVEGFGAGDRSGSLEFAKGGVSLDMAWFDAKYYPEYRDDRAGQSPPEPVTVAGWPGFTIRYADTDFATMLEPRNGVFAELRAQGAVDKAQYDDLLLHVKRVDVPTWLAAMPPEIITPDEVQQAAARTLADVPLPPGFDVRSLNGLGTNDAYQFTARVIGAVGCGWIEEWKRAKAAGDDAAVTRAQEVLKGSHHWAALKEMNAEGYPRMFWFYTDPVAAGREPGTYQRALSC